MQVGDAGGDTGADVEPQTAADFPGGQATLQATSPNCPAPISSTVTVLGGTTTTIPGPATCESGGLVVTFPSTKLIDFDGFNPKVEYTPPDIYSQGFREKLVVMVEASFDPVVAPRLRPGLPIDVYLEPAGAGARP